jgi:glutathione S-transferase
MRTVFGASPSPFVRKVRVVLAEKGLEYESVPAFPGPTAPPDFKLRSPLGKIPYFRDGDRWLADSSVICAYLERVHPTPALHPADPYDYARALWFEEYADGGMVPVIGAKIFFPKVVAPRFFNQPCNEADVAAAIANDVPPFCDYLEGELAGDFFVGNQLTIGDIAVASVFVNLRHCGVAVDAKRWPKLAGFVQRMHARPSFAPLIAEDEGMLGTQAA